MRTEAQQREEQLRILETISANFAHRMSNLAGTSRVATQLLRERIDPSDDLSHRQLSRIEREADILLGLSKQLARPFRETGRMFELMPIDIVQILIEELEQIEPQLGRIVVTQNLAPSLPNVQSVDFQLQQVLHDIISNAIEAIKDQEDGQLAIGARFNVNTNHVEVEVSDNGPGVRHDIRDKLFAPGITTKQEKLGIGLWWCRTFMQATGGNVILKYTEPGKGTTFLIEIPCVGAEKAFSLGKEEIDVLIVDDRKRWQDMLVDAITSRHYTFKIATNYTEARHALEINQFKLAVMDIRLVDADPVNEDGLRLLADIDEAGLDTKVIIVTGYGTPEQREAARQNPNFLDFIKKDEFDLATFRDLVRQAVG
jgi:CheY-like chemotaxis protein